ncbi:MAG: hypothetical protein ACXVAY_00940 [Mucilaginibacter sp.]
MDNIYLYLIAGAIVAVLLVFLNNKRQNTTVAGFLEDAQSSKPMLMQQAVEKKLRTLKTSLFLNQGSGGKAKIEIPEARRQSLIKQLNELEKSHADGNLSLKAYDEALHQLVLKLSQ